MSIRISTLCDEQCFHIWEEGLAGGGGGRVGGSTIQCQTFLSLIYAEFKLKLKKII